jgi:hypothetical protein
MKTIDDYMNGPEIIKMPEYLREIHAARRMIQDETRDMPPEKKGAYIHNEAISALVAVGITPGMQTFPARAN